MRSPWVALALATCTSAARADWQPEELPPVPPETEAAEQARALTPSTFKPNGASAARGTAGSTPTIAGANPPAVTPTSTPSTAPAAGTAGVLESNAGTTFAAPGSQSADPLAAFPPAPPPAQELSAPSVQTQFSPAPGPAPAPSEPAGSGPAALPPIGATTATPPTAAGSEPVATQSASALPNTDDSSTAREAEAAWSAAALLGVGVTFDSTVAGVNPLGFGFGVRGDYRIAPSWAVGARLLYFVGGSVELPSSELSMQSWLVAAEGSYVIRLDPVTIQPGLVVGLHVRESDSRTTFIGTMEEPVDLTPPSNVRPGFYVAPGFNVSVPLSIASESLAPLHVGGDVRVDFAFGKHVTSNLQALLQLGVSF